MNFPRFESEWEGFKGHVALTWDKLTNEELLKIQGNLSDLVKLISDKYGEKKHVVEERIQSLYNSYLAKKSEIQKDIADLREDIQVRSHAFMETIKDKAAELQNTTKETIRKIREDNIEPVVNKSEEYIKVHPFTAVFGALGLGFILGGLIGLLSKKE